MGFFSSYEKCPWCKGSGIEYNYYFCNDASPEPVKKMCNLCKGHRKVKFIKEVDGIRYYEPKW